MENLDNFYCEQAVDEFYNNKSNPTPIAYIEDWLLKYADLRIRVRTNYPLAGKPTIRVGETDIPAFRDENIERFFLLYRYIIDFPKYYKLITVAEQAVVEYNNIINSAKKEEVIEAIKNWLLKYEHLGTKELLYFHFEDTEDLESSFFNSKNINIYINEGDFEPISSFNKVFQLEFFENKLLPERLKLLYDS